MFKGSKMKMFVMILTIVMVSCFAIAAVTYVAQYGTKGISINENLVTYGNNLDVDEEKSAPVSDVKNIIVNTISEDINFIMTDSNEAKAHFYGKFSSNKKDYKPEFVVKSEAGTLTIEIRHESFINFSYNSNIKLDIYLPKSFSGDLNISTVSSRVEIDEMNLESFKCTTTSGDLNARLVNSNTAEFKTISGKANISGKYESFSFNSTSGDFKTDGINAGEAKFNTNSGRISISGEIGDLEMKSTSGDMSAALTGTKDCRFSTISGRISAAGVPGNADITTTSGDINLDYSTFDNDITIKTISGEADLKLPEGSQFALKYNSASGSAKCDFPIILTGSSDDNDLEGNVGSSDNKITVTSTSGDLRIDI